MSDWPAASTVGWFLLVLAFGAGVGASELIARYKDAPFAALKSVPARWYIIVNAAASGFAYILIVKFDVPVGGPDQRALMQAVLAGFGSMVFFRSSLFTMRVGEHDVSVGPALLFQILLSATDRQCDRERAEPRSALVNAIMKGVSFAQARDSLPSYCFELMQNVPPAEQQQFRQVVDALASSTTMRDNIKVLNLGLMLMNVVGSQVLSAAVRTLGEKIQGPAKLELEVFSLLQKGDFKKAFPLLVDACFIMSRYGTEQEQAVAKQAALTELAPLEESKIDNGSKMTFLGLSLQQRVGDSVLLDALIYVADGIQRAPAVQPAPTAAPEHQAGPVMPPAEAEIVQLHPEQAAPADEAGS